MADQAWPGSPAALDAVPSQAAQPQWPGTPATIAPQQAQPEQDAGRLVQISRGANTLSHAEPAGADDRAAYDKALGLARGIGRGNLISKVGETVAGKHDPAYAGLRSFDEEMQAENNAPAIRKMRLAAPIAATDEGYGDIMKNSLAERFIRKEKDANGYDVIVYSGPDGAERKAYVNKPGLDSEDVGRALISSVPYVVGGVGTGLLTRGAGMVGRTIAQALTASGTSIAGDRAAQELGSEQHIDPTRASAMGLFAGAGEVASPAFSALWQKFVTVPGLFDRVAGRLTPQGVQAAQSAGLDPAALTADLAREFAKTYAKSPDAARAGAKFATNQMGIESTIGQRTKDAEKLLEEGGIRRGLQGENAKSIMTDFDKRQAEQVKAAALGSYAPIPGSAIPAHQLKPGIATELAPGRMLEELNPASLGQGIREGMTSARSAAKAQERAAWGATSDVLAHPQALDQLPQSLGGQLGDRIVDRELTPTAYKMAESVDRYMTGAPMQSELKSLGSASGITTVDQMRRRLGGMISAAKDPADRGAAKSIYRGFDDWIDAADRQGLLTGSQDAIANLRIARNTTKALKDLFEPRQFGQKTPGSRILADVMDKSDSAEGIVSGLFGGGPKSNIKDGAIEALQKMRAALTQHRDPHVAQDAWNDIRAAYWTRLVQGKNGEMLGPQAILTNVQTAFANQRSIMNALYTPQEQQRMRLFEKAMKEITYKDPNPSGSGYAIAAFAKQFISTIMDAVGLHNPLVRAAGAVAAAPFKNAAGASAARAATSQTGRPAPPPSLGGFVAGAGQAYKPDRTQ